VKTYPCNAKATLISIEQIRPVKLTNRGLPRLQGARDDLASGRALDPVAVFDYQGRYLLADGMHRYTAAKEMGLTHLPCVFWPTEEYNLNLEDYVI
jgi:ParB-like chromosome segregation protein Spo0J